MNAVGVIISPIWWIRRPWNISMMLCWTSRAVGSEAKKKKINKLKKKKKKRKRMEKSYFWYFSRMRLVNCSK